MRINMISLLLKRARVRTIICFVFSIVLLSNMAGVLFTTSVVYASSTDINGDGVVNRLDLRIICEAFGSYPGHPNWNPEADLNNDDLVNMTDLALAVIDYASSMDASQSIGSDINGDGVVDMLDLRIICEAFGSYPGHPNWNPEADLNNDDLVNMTDLALAVIDYIAGAPTGVWRPWSDDSYWNTKIPENPKIHPNSAQMINWFLNVPEHYGGTFQINIHSWSDTIWECDENTPRYTIYRPSGAVAFTNVPIPDNFVHDPQADAGAVIIDHSEEWMYTTAGLEKQGGKWVATIAIARWPLYGSGVTDNYQWIAGGASIPSYCAMIRPEEIEAGVIPRAIACCLHTPKAGWKVYPPASSTDGKSYDRWAIPEGARLQLDPDFDIDSLNVNRAAKIILKCFQEYGVVVKECGGRSCIYAENPLARTTDPWPELGVDSNILKGSELRNLPWRVIDYSVFGAVEEEF